MGGAGPREPEDGEADMRILHMPGRPRELPAASRPSRQQGGAPDNNDRRAARPGTLSPLWAEVARVLAAASRRRNAPPSGGGSRAA